MDVQSRARWEQYTKAKEEMLDRTHIPEAPWWVVQAVDKKVARLNCIHHLLEQFPYTEVQHPPVQLALLAAAPRKRAHMQRFHEAMQIAIAAGQRSRGDLRALHARRAPQCPDARI